MEEENQENALQEATPDEPVVEDDSDVVEVDDEADSEVADLRRELQKKQDKIDALATASREEKKAMRDAKKSDKSKQTNKQSDGLDYGQKAYLNTKGIEESEHGFIQDQLSESGLELNELLNNGYFKAKLQEQIDTRVVKEATPSGTRGAKEPANSKTAYWLDKGELPPNTPENRKLRAEVVNARIKSENNRSSFTEIPIVDA